MASDLSTNDSNESPYSHHARIPNPANHQGTTAIEPGASLGLVKAQSTETAPPTGDGSERRSPDHRGRGAGGASHHPDRVMSAPDVHDTLHVANA
jgi:hypothetical protein